MGQILHGCATTTEAVRRAIQNSQESLRALAKRYGINQKTVAKWKQRETVADLPTGPKEAKSTVLSIEEEAIIVAIRLPCRQHEIRFCRRIGTYWLPCRLQFRKRTRSRYENDADDQNSRHRDHQSRF